MEQEVDDRTEQREAAVFRSDASSDLGSSSDLLTSVVEEKDHLQVYLRIRPYTAAESNTAETQDCVTIESLDTVLVKAPVSCQLLRQSTAATERPLQQTGQRFQFSQVYGPDTSQKQLYDGTVKDLVKDVLTGANSLVFTYGVSNAGKTFTFLGPDADAGLVPRALGTIFNSIEEHVYSDVSIKPHRCREFSRLTKEQQVEQILLKRNLLKQSREGDRNTLNSTLKTQHEAASTLTSDDRISLERGAHTKFSVWVSFCEIYNENIHDLLEALPSSSQRRTALRLSQDVKGHSFVKDLRWVHVDTAEEAYRVLKLGKKNQSFSSTKLNQLSSRSHSIFSIRILRIEDVGMPRVSAISELCMCDLAGSERCAKTQNKGERLKEAGNINSSLLILGKCINALRHNQQAKLLQHVPFRESKLTHYLQSFLCGRGRACMIVNANPCPAMYDETLNVLKFSAVAQKVVVLNSRNQQLLPERSSPEVSFVLDSAEERPQRRRRSSLSVWDTSLEDVQEDEGDECESSLMDDTNCSLDQTTEHQEKVLICKKTYQSQVALLGRLQVQLKQELSESLAMESRIRDEISKEFSEIFSEMQKDFDERLAREREILEERAEKRLEIFKNLSQKMSRDGPYQDRHAAMDPFSAELSDMDTYPDAYLTGVMGERSHAFESCDESGAESEERAALLKQLQEKSFQVSALEKQVTHLQRALEQSGHSSGLGTTEQLQQALANAEKQKQAREDALAALEYQTVGREEALASLEVEKKAREQAQSALSELQKNHRDVSRALEEEKRGKEGARAALEEERRAKDELAAALREEKRRRQEAQATGHRHDQNMEEQLATLKEKNKARQQECEELRVEVKELRAKLQATESKGSVEAEQVEHVSAQLRAAQSQLDKLSSEVEDKTRQIQSLTQEVDSVKQELQTSVASSELSVNLLKDEVSELRATLASEKEHSKRKNSQISQMERELASAKEQLSMEKLMSEQKLAELGDKLQRQSASKEEMETLRKKLAERDETLQRRLDELKAKLELQENEKKQLRAQLEEEKQNSEQAKEKQDASSGEQLEALQKRLDEQQAASDQLLCDAKLQLYEQQEQADKLRADLELANGKCAALRDYNQQTDDQAGRIQELERLLEEKERAHKGKLAEAARKAESAQKKLEEKEKEVAALQKSLEQREEAESQAVQETRRREVERRRELLAKAEEAIAQKDAELEKKSAEISRLTQSSQQDMDRVKGLSVELQRKEEHSNELQEKLADYKKQMQQVQKEISSMREDERSLKQKLSDLDKSKKQLQMDLANRDRTILNLKTEQSSSKSEQAQQLYQNACKELESKNQAMENMRLALSEQEETQEQMEHVMEEKDGHIQELTNEVDKLKTLLLRRDGTSGNQTDNSSAELRVAQDEAAQAQENLKTLLEKQRAERKAWQEEKLSLLAQAKEAEERRNQDMRRFAEDREKYQRQHSQVESLSSQLAQKEQSMEQWRKDRDALVSALELQLQKLLSSQSQKDKLIQELQQRSSQPPPAEASEGLSVAELQATLSERDAEILRLREELQSAAQAPPDDKKIKSSQSPESEDLVRKSRGRRETRTSVISQTSTSCPSVLDSSEISTENGRTSRFPKPELEISFSPLQPNRMALKRQGDESAVTVKITRSTRKRKSNEMDKDEVEAENQRNVRKNTRTKVTPKLTPHQEEKPSAYGRHDSQSSVRSRKAGTLQKIGDYLQSSPTLLGSKAKKMMGLVSGRDMDSSGSAPSSLRAKKTKRKLFRPEISSPMEMPPHPIMSREPEEKESDHQIIKRCLRSRVVK